jgi:hypothetical protein
MIEALYVKRQRGESLIPRVEIGVSPGGVDEGVPTSPVRQVLLLPRATLDEFGLKPEDLRPNVIVNDTQGVPLHSLPSGTVLEVGGVSIRLTVHCEPCARVSQSGLARTRLLHRRGYFGQVLTSGQLWVGDAVRSRGQQFEPIPYPVRDRLIWFLRRQNRPIRAAELALAAGVATAYCRAMPRMLRDSGLEHLVQYGERPAPGLSVPRARGRKPDLGIVTAGFVSESSCAAMSL